MAFVQSEVERHHQRDLLRWEQEREKQGLCDSRVFVEWTLLIQKGAPCLLYSLLCGDVKGKGRSWAVRGVG